VGVRSLTHPRPPPHGQVSSPADSLLPTLALPRMDRPHRQQTPSPRARLSRMGQVSPPADPPLLTLTLPRMDKSHRQQTPFSPRSPSPAWTGLPTSRLPSRHARPPPHGQASSPADSPLPRMDRSHRQQSPLPALALPRMDRSHRQQTPLSPRASPAWTGLTASRLPSPHARLPPHGQVSPPADSPLPTPALPRMDRSHRQQTPLSIAPPNPFPSVSP